VTASAELAVLRAALWAPDANDPGLLTPAQTSLLTDQYELAMAGSAVVDWSLVRTACDTAHARLSAGWLSVDACVVFPDTHPAFCGCAGD